jgi:RNA polymerase sigma-70 factor (ECF subfamily)
MKTRKLPLEKQSQLAEVGLFRNKIARRVVWSIEGFDETIARLNEDEQRERFEQIVLPHLDAAYNLARWLTNNNQDAQDVVQEACLRALKFFNTFRGENARAWLLTIVRRTCYSWLSKNRAQRPLLEPTEELDALEDPGPNPDVLLARTSDLEAVRQAVEQLPDEFREAIVLREMEGLSYKEIADAVSVPIGTVMSRLARARKQLQQYLTQQTKDGALK